MTPIITIAEQYESNPDFVVGGEDDWVASTVVSPEIIVSRSYKKSDLRGAVGADLAYYPGNSEFNNERYRASLGLNITHSPKTTFTLAESFSYSEDSLSFDPDPDTITDTTGILVERSDILSNRLSFSVRHSKSESFTIGLDLTDRRTEYDLSSLSDTRSTSIAPIIELEKALDPKTNLSISYDFTRYYIESGGSNETRDTHSLLVGVDHRITPGFSFTASVGAVYSPESGFDYGLIGDLELSKSTRRSEISLIYSRRADVTPFTNDLNIHQGVSARLISELTKDVNVTVRAGVNKNESETSDAVDVVSYNTGATISWQVYSWMSVEGGYRYFDQESDGSVGDDLIRNTAFVSVKFIPAVWRF